jgi:hypothetical protein
VARLCRRPLVLLAAFAFAFAFVFTFVFVGAFFLFVMPGTSR